MTKTPPQPAAPKPRGEMLTALLTGAAVLAVYVATLAPTVTEGDSGALITVVHTTGIAHAPGYPLYILLCKLFTVLPAASVAWRVNLASAFFAAAAAALLMLFVARLTANRWAGIAAAGVFAFSPYVWHYAVVAEVFSLNNLFIAAILLAALAYVERPGSRRLWLLAFLSGLAVSHHQTSAFLLLPLWVGLGWNYRTTLLTPRALTQLAAFFVLGLTPILYLPLVGANDPVVNWGHDMTTAGGVMRHVLRSEYGTLSLMPGMTGTSADVNRAIFAYLADLPAQTAYAGVLLAGLGLYAGYRSQKMRGVAIVTAAVFVLYVVVFHSLARLPLGASPYLVIHLQKFWLLPTLFVCVWVGIGIAQIGQRTTLGAAAAALVIVATQLALNYRMQDQSGNRLFELDAAAKLANLPRDAILLTSGDNYNNTTKYLQLCEGVRPDVDVLSLEFLGKPHYGPTARRLHPRVEFPGDVFVASPTPVQGSHELSDQRGRPIGRHSVYSLSVFIDANVGERPVYATKFFEQSAYANERSWQASYDLVALGTLVRVMGKQDALSFDALVREAPRYLPDLAAIGAMSFREDSWAYQLWSSYWDDYRRMMLGALAVYWQDGGKPASLAALVGVMEAFAANSPNALPGAFYWELGGAYAALAESDPAAATRLQQLHTEHLRKLRAPSPAHKSRVEAALDSGR